MTKNLKRAKPFFFRGLLYDWSQYPNIFHAYRKGDENKWALTQIKKKSLRDMGGTLSSTAAHQIALGAETMALRMDRSCANALALALVVYGQDHSLVAFG